MNTANSITASSSTGSDSERVTSRMMTKIDRIEMALTTSKSWDVTSIRSLVQGASPISMPVESYFLRIAFRSSIWALTSSVAVPYSEEISISW